MSVYTTVEPEQLKQFLRHFDVGDLQDYEGISAGIENTNYFVNTDKGQYVLTLFESLAFDELPYFLNLMAHLNEHDVQCAHPVPAEDGRYLLELNGKPTSLVNRLPGKEVKTPIEQHAIALGRALGHMHVAGTGFSEHRKNDRGPGWWRETVKRLTGHIDDEDAAILENEIHFQMKTSRTELPRGVVHADLFKDNTLWDNDQLTGIIDFYFACDDVLLYDIAVTVNAWFFNEDGHIDHDLVLAFLKAYHSQRPLMENEKQAWPTMLRAGALRFWLSRLNDMHFPKPGEMTHTKNPDEFRHILLCHIENDSELHELWVE
jgi:homoserine kinase type II